MSYPFTFGSLPTGNVPAANLDANFNAIGAIACIPCSCSGTNTLTLTPASNTPSVTAYFNYQQFQFVAAASSSGTVTVNIAGVGAKTLYNSDGTVVGNGGLAAGTLYLIAYQSGLNSGSGGFVIQSPGVGITQTAVNATVQSQTGNSGVDSGSVNSYALTLSPVLAAYANILYAPIRMKVSHTNTGAATLNINTIGAVNIVGPDGGALNAGDLLLGEIVELFYDGTNFQYPNAGATTARQGLVQLAQNSDATAATNSSLVMSPTTTTYHPGVLKAWVHFSVSGTTPTIVSSFNVSTVTRSSSGIYVVTITATNMQAFMPVVSAVNGATGTLGYPEALLVSGANTFKFINVSNSTVDPTEVFIGAW